MTVSMFNADHLHKALNGIGINTPGDIFESLAIAYAEPWRHYHTQTHIAQCLKLAKQYRAIALAPEELEVALWFHDAIYDPKRQDNEENSAQWAQAYLTSVNVDTPIIDRIVAMILATKTHDALGGDTALLLDIDLSILGAVPHQFEVYDRAIRQEYQWVLESDYSRARRRILQSFLLREPLYQTSTFRDHYETQARQNLTQRINRMD